MTVKNVCLATMLDWQQCDSMLQGRVTEDFLLCILRKIEIYNLKEQKVITLADDHYKAGRHHIIWNADDQPSGVYFYKINNGSYTTSKKMILTK